MEKYINEIITELRKFVKTNLDVIHGNNEKINNHLSENRFLDSSPEMKNVYENSKVLLTQNHDFIKMQNLLQDFYFKYKDILEGNGFVTPGNAKPTENKQFKVGSDFQRIKNVPRKSELVERVEELKELKLTEDELLEKTISGELQYNREHPLFDNEAFYNRLFECHVKAENYEMCQYLKELKR